MTVKLEDIITYSRYIKKLNECELTDIVITKNDVVLAVNDKDICNFKFTGLNNIDFIKFYFINNNDLNTPSEG